MAKREENREVTYLSDKTRKRLHKFVENHATLKSKSRTLETALEFYLEMAEKHGLDDRWWPKIV